MEGDVPATVALDRFRPPTWLRWLAVVAVAGVLFYGSVLDSPGSGLSPVGPFGLFGLDKWLHALGYAALAGALAGALATRGRLRGRRVRVVALAILLAVGYGVGIEFVQATIPERAFSLGDMAADLAGAGVGAAAWRVLVGLVTLAERTAGSER
ncbi:VanZ family protein [Halorussus halobius]|uniref:VanZ family protein n=1 Tax=Halorussus halobius TaxID=1710537 RepID=UPI001091A5BD|nr:VanZ family protein [Halorussus halobius]